MPYVHQSVDMLEILPQLATGARCAVFICVGLFDADPLGASKRDILDYTGLSRPTVENALHFLERSELVYFTPKTKRYRPNPKYVSFRGVEAENIRELVPIVRGENAEPERQNIAHVSAILQKERGAQRLVKNFFTSDIVVVDERLKQEQSFSKKQQQTNGAREKLRACGIFGKALLSLSETVSEEIASEWSEWIARAPKSIRNPAGLMISALLADADARPPKMLMPKETPRAPGRIIGKMARGDDETA